MKLHKGDMVKVITGKDKGKTGKILLMYTDKAKALVEKINMVKRHQKPSQRYKQGGVIEKESPIHVSNVMFYEEKAGKATRIGAKVVDGKKVRTSVRSGEVVGVKQ